MVVPRTHYTERQPLSHDQCSPSPQRISQARSLGRGCFVPRFRSALARGRTSKRSRCNACCSSPQRSPPKLLRTKAAADPGSAPPESDQSGAATPKRTLSTSAVPDSALPGSALPGSGQSRSALPGSAQSRSALPGSTTSGPAQPGASGSVRRGQTSPRQYSPGQSRPPDAVTAAPRRLDGCAPCFVAGAATHCA